MVRAETILQGVRRQALAVPGAAALITPAGSVSYAQLLSRVDAVATVLVAELADVHGSDYSQHAVPPRVAVRYAPSENLVVGLLAALASGACCVPVTSAHTNTLTNKSVNNAPSERVTVLLADAQPTLLLAPEIGAETSGIHPAGCRLIDMAALLTEAQETQERVEPSSAVARLARPEGPAFALYTSGTSGHPKAVLMRHQGFANLARVHAEAFSLSHNSRVLIYGSPVHGNWINSLLIALVNGATAVIEPENNLLPGPELLQILRSKAITHVHLPPSSLAALPHQELPELQVITLGGEALAVETVRPWLSQARIFNCYGTTEANWLAFAELTEASRGRLTIGRPITGMQAQLVDNHLQPVQEGEVGELLVSGIGLAQGYLNDPDLTREKFIRVGKQSSELWYRTGDLGRIHADGQYQIIGRNDAQLSIRGFRVEPGEIEAALIEHPEIDQAAVHGEPTTRGTTVLVASLSLGPGATLSVQTLRAWLRKLIPHYMTPARFRVTDRLPLLESGKLNRRALPTLSCTPLQGVVGAGTGDSRAPVSPNERAIAKFWSAYTEEPEPWLDSDFFLAGGDSLGAVQLLWDLSSDYGIELRTADFLLQPTLAALVTTVEYAAECAIIKNSEPSTTASEIAESLSAPLTATQQRLWHISNYAPDGALYNVPYLLELDGNVEPAFIESAMRCIIARHQPLRCSIALEDGQLVQRVRDEKESGTSRFQLSMRDVTEGSTSTASYTAAERARAIIEQEANRPFDLSAEFTPRAMLIALGPQTHQLLIVLHHLVCDGWSVANLFRELCHHYNSQTENARPNTAGGIKSAAKVLSPVTAAKVQLLPALPASYFQYARRASNSAASRESLEYWRNYLQDAPSRIQLPLDYAYPEQEDFKGTTISRPLDTAIVEGVERVATRFGITVSAVYLGAYFMLLQRIGAGDDLTLGVPLIGHEQADTRHLIGLFASVVPQRIRLTTATDIRELLIEVNRNLRLAIAHQSVPLQNTSDAQSIDETGGARTGDLSPITPSRLLQTVFSHQNVLSKDDVSLVGVVSKIAPVFPKTSKFELLVNVEKQFDGWSVSAEYRTALFDHATIDQLLANYQGILHFLCGDAAKTVGEIGWPHESPRLTSSLVAEKSTVTDNSLHSLFERQCQLRSGAIALVAGHQRLSYGELNERANQVASSLAALGIERGQVIGLHLPRSSEAAVAIIGVLKAGGAYLQLPVDYPYEKLAQMARDAQCVLVIKGDSSGSAREFAIREVTCSELLASRPEADIGRNIRASAGETAADNLAYVMYTSGTTGSANPVAVTHGGIIRLANNPDYVRLTPSLITLQLAPLAFDASTFELWSAWLNGGCCVLYPEEQIDFGRLAEIIESEGINTLWLTSSLFNAVVDENVEALQGIETLLVGGEALSVPHITHAQAALPGTVLINGYGPTECTTFACTYTIHRSFDSKRLRVPIGTPINDTSAWVLDHRLKPSPPGLVGELYLGGRGLARGYINNTALTEERFVTLELGGQRQRLYKTGDLVVEQADGNLQFLGREDEQLKINGYRIEPQYVERILNSDPAVGRAAVIVRKRSNTASLIAMLETKSSAGPGALEDIKNRVNSKFAHYERPSDYYLVDNLPLTANGKLDRKTLESLMDARAGRPTPQSVTQTDQASDPIEAWLVGLWCELLGSSQVTPADNFFDLGGNSLLAIRCMERIRQTFHTELPLSLLFEAGSARELASVVRAAARTSTRWSPLVTIRPGSHQSNSRNLFLVHSIGGEVLGFADFCRYLTGDLAVYALQARGALANQQPHNNLSAMASDYIAELQRVQPRGPYRLGGISMGGLIAHEMAVQLSRDGHQVDYLLIGDTWFSSGGQLRWQLRPKYVWKLFQNSAELLRGRQARGVRKTEPVKARAMQTKVQRERRASMTTAHHSAIRNHTPGHFSGPIHLFRSSELSRAHLRDEVSLGDATMGWNKLTTSGVSLTILEGNHSSIFYGQGAERFAAELEASLPA